MGSVLKSQMGFSEILIYYISKSLLNIVFTNLWRVRDNFTQIEGKLIGQYRTPLRF
jgi:hypothetical protein